MRQVGPLLEPLGIFEFANGKSWGIQFNDQIAIFLDFDSDQKKLTISADLGRPETRDKLSLYELFLLNNNAWDLTGGTKLAIDSADGNAILIFDLYCGTIEVPLLISSILCFVDTAQAWKKIIADTGMRHDQNAPIIDINYPILRV